MVSGCCLTGRDACLDDEANCEGRCGGLSKRSTSMTSTGGLFVELILLRTGVGCSKTVAIVVRGSERRWLWLMVKERARRPDHPLWPIPNQVTPCDINSEKGSAIAKIRVRLESDN